MIILKNKLPKKIFNVYNNISFQYTNGTFIKFFSYYQKENGKYFDKILIANRGEIACRIIKTAKKLGIKTVGIFSKPDYKSKHVEMSDESICIGPALAKDSYLSKENILEAAKLSGAEAIHPGYGFLSENAQFVKLLQKNNITFIGPTAEVIEKMGDKLQSKRIAIEAGISTIPGFNGIVSYGTQCVEIARKIGYPVMIKASAGGGGKGMRIAWNDNEVRTGFKLSSQEALSSFADDRILIEKFIKNPRHIEVQILGDNYGNIIHLGERECSIQRRNQKIIEESPSPFLDAKTRDLMTEQAIKLCKKLNYTSAGTIEFLVDENRNFYFLEMNTRLQVEHPVTELVTGVDLVEQMIKIAAGRKIDLTQDSIKIKGWALESRIYAEDPYKNFGLPSVGKLKKYIEPTFLPNTRFDSGVKEGSEISVFYDPLICKLVCYGKNREEAIENSVKALDSYLIQGVVNNIPILYNILKEKNFKTGNLNTNYLNETYPNGFNGAQLNNKEIEQIISLTTVLFIISENKYAVNSKEIKINSPKVTINFMNKIYEGLITKSGNIFKIKINDNFYEISDDIDYSNPLISIKINNEKCIFQLISMDAVYNFKLIYQGTPFSLTVIPENISKYLKYIKNKPKPDTTKIVKSSMPGLIKHVNVQNGDNINEGQEICIIEAMKMQNSISAPKSGTVKKISIKNGDIVGDNDVIMIYQ